MSLVNWLEVADYMLVGGLGAFGTLLATKIVNRRSGNGSTHCQLHSVLTDDINEIKNKVNNCVTTNACGDKHNQLLQKIDDLKDDVIHRIDRLEDRLNARQDNV